MKTIDQFYIDGQWTAPQGKQVLSILNPATSVPCVAMACANETDVNAAAEAAFRAFPAWSATPSDQRALLMMAIADEMENRADDLVQAHVETMGIPRHQAMEVQIAGPIDAMRYFASLAATMGELDDRGGYLISHEPVGVCALINPWNYPLLQMIGKVAPALAAGCTMLAKPAEQTPTSDIIMAEIFDKVGLPAGVFNLITGLGAEVGPLMASHPRVDMVSFTGSNRSGISVAIEAAPTVKRVCQEMGGKSALIITEDADLHTAVRYGVENVMLNTGQTCDALTRMLVPSSRYQEAVDQAVIVANEQVVGDPDDPLTTMGPLASEQQRQRVRDYIKQGIAEGARMVIGGAELPASIEGGAYVLPTLFADVRQDMVIAREEIFGPVLCIMAYETIDEAVDIANDSEFGLSSGVFAANDSDAIAIARRMRAGQCFIQGGFFRLEAPFGGYKQSGNGREWGEAGLAEYQEIKAIIRPN